MWLLQIVQDPGFSLFLFVYLSCCGPVSPQTSTFLFYFFIERIKYVWVLFFFNIDHPHRAFRDLFYASLLGADLWPLTTTLTAVPSEDENADGLTVFSLNTERSSEPKGGFEIWDCWILNLHFQIIIQSLSLQLSGCVEQVGNSMTMTMIRWKQLQVQTCSFAQCQLIFWELECVCTVRLFKLRCITSRGSVSVPRGRRRSLSVPAEHQFFQCLSQCLSQSVERKREMMPWSWSSLLPPHGWIGVLWLLNCSCSWNALRRWFGFITWKHRAASYRPDVHVQLGVQEALLLDGRPAVLPEFFIFQFDDFVQRRSQIVLQHRQQTQGEAGRSEHEWVHEETSALSTFLQHYKTLLEQNIKYKY